MKSPRRFTHLCALLSAGALVLTNSTSHATPYASGLTNDNGTVSFILNENADDVTVILDGTTTNHLGMTTKGLHSFALNAATNYQIVVTKASVQGWLAGPGAGGTAPALQISTDTNVTAAFNAPRGVAVNHNPRSPYFGRIFVANDNYGSTTTPVRTLTRGMYIMNADQTDAIGQGDTAVNAGTIEFGGTTSSPYRVRVGEDDNLYITDWSDATGNLYRTDQSCGYGTGQFALQPLIGTAAVPVGDANNHGSICAAYASGSEAAGNLQIFTIDEDLQSDHNATTANNVNSLWRYDVGSGPVPYTSNPTQLWTPAGSEGIGFTSQTMDMDRATNGYFFITDMRSNGGECGLVVRDADGTTTVFNSVDWSKAMGYFRDYLSNSTAVAVSPDDSWVAVANGNGKITLMPLTNGIPNLARRSLLTAYTTTTVREVAFDAANNLYVVNSGTAAMRIFSPGGTTTAITSNDVTGTNGTFSVTMVDPALASQPASQTPNAGTTVTLTSLATGTGPLSYQWRKNGVAISGATTSSYSMSNVQKANSATYSLVVTNLQGTVTSSDAVVNVIDTTPIITVQPTSASQGAGTSKAFSVTATGTDPRSYQWTFNGVAIPGAVGSSYTRSGIQQAVAGNYACYISNPLGWAVTTNASLIVTDAPPVITAMPANKTIGLGMANTYSVTTTGTDPRFYQWLRNGSPISGATASSYVLTNAQTSDAGSYTCTISNAVSPYTATTTNAVLTVTNVVNAIVTTAPKSVTNASGANVTFSVAAYGPSPLTYQWSCNSSPISGATSSSYTVTNVQTANSGSTYSVTLNPGAITPAAATLTVTNGKPTIVTQPTPQGTDPGVQATFSVVAQGEAPLTYQWMFNGTNTIANASDSLLTIPNPQMSDVGSYSVIVSSTGGSVTSSVVLLAVTMPHTDGTGTGLTGQYYNQFKSFMGAPNLTRVDPVVDFIWGTGSPDPTITVDYYTVRWTGQVQPLYPQAYTFYTATDDGCRLWFDGNLVINSWVPQGVTEKSYTTTNALDPNKKYDVVLEYFEQTSTAEAHLRWSSDSQIKTNIQTAQLYPAPTVVQPKLSTSVSGTNIIVNWAGNYILQTAPSVEGPYSDAWVLNGGYTNLPNAAIGAFTNTAAGSQTFFRLKDY